MLLRTIAIASQSVIALIFSDGYLTCFGSKVILFDWSDIFLRTAKDAKEEEEREKEEELINLLRLI